MATEFETQVTTPHDVNALGAETEQVVQQTTQQARTGATGSRGNAVSIPASTLGKIKAEQRERGQREAMNQLEAKFKAAGFGSIDDALGAMAALRSGGQSQQQQQAPSAGAQASSNAQQARGRDERKELERLQREREAYAKRYAQEQAQRRRLQRQLEAKEAEMALRETAVVKGVRDVDYALRLLQRDLEGRDDATLAEYDEGAFFEKLRGSHPYLFGEMVVPANTGTGVGGAPTAPKAGQVQQAQGAAGKADARSMNREEFQKLLKARGLNIAVG